METARRWVQTLFFFLSNGYWGFPVSRNIYQGPLKALCSPGLNCYSCPAATTACPIGALQQLLLGIRLSLDTAQYYLGLSVLGAMGLLGALCGRFVCGWVCPFGLIQELLHRVPSPKYGVWPALRWLKYVMLIGPVLLLPLLVVNEFGLGYPWFCKFVCPAGTLEAGLPMIFLQPDLRTTIGWLFYNKLVILIAVLGWSVFASRPFCRTLCPLGAFYGLFNRHSLVKMYLDREACNDCGACHHVCPVGLRFNENPESPECIRCLRCMTMACPRQAIGIDIAGGRFLPAAAGRGAAKTA